MLWLPLSQPGSTRSSWESRVAGIHSSGMQAQYPALRGTSVMAKHWKRGLTVGGVAILPLVLFLALLEVRAQPPNEGGLKTVQGKVESFTTAPLGEVDGAVLDDGTVVHWPPHLGDRIANMIGKGDRIRATGWMETGPAGDTHLEIQSLTNLRTERFVRPAGWPAAPETEGEGEACSAKCESTSYRGWKQDGGRKGAEPHDGPARRGGRRSARRRHDRPLAAPSGRSNLQYRRQRGSGPSNGLDGDRTRRGHPPGNPVD